MCNVNKKVTVLFLAPVFWEGQDDIKFLRWKENVDVLVDRLIIVSEGLTYKVVELLNQKIDPT